jgi:signal transduction histidine kinase
VQDTGAGIAPGDLPKIFDRFYRGDVSRTRATGNSGLGLAIVRSIVEAHDGTIMAESAPGAGACFILRLPLASEPAAAAAPGRAASPSA